MRSLASSFFSRNVGPNPRTDAVLCHRGTAEGSPFPAISHDGKASPATPHKGLRQDFFLKEGGGGTVGRRPASKTEAYAGSRHAPRPVTVRLLQTSRAPRLGEASLLVDGAACSGVVLCGRVLARAGLNTHNEASLGLRGPTPLSWFVISDGTGVIGVVQYPTTWTVAHAAEGEDEASAATPSTAASLASRGVLGDGVGGHSVRDAILQAAVDVAEGGYCIPAEEMDIRVDDYVLCIGRLCFADIDPTVEKLFGSLPIPSYFCSSSSGSIDNAPTASSEAAFMKIDDAVNTSSREVIPETHGKYGGCNELGANNDAYEGRIKDKMRLRPLSSKDKSMENVTYVLPPGARSPVAMRDLCELGISPENVPPGTRFFGVAEPTDCSQTQDLQPGFYKRKDPINSMFQKVNALRVTDSGNGMGPTVPRFCVKGKVRLISSSNEILFWWLSAIDTHVRLKSITLGKTVNYN
ncbi:unnamed protein product [Phytomonas sp. Hart1]|nr:unnamed protein product [Phytomonas sp. Hart1]|eukprot:CCW69319.1 unnamed protein product [Phytomonas sp. isolate Hart1]